MATNVTPPLTKKNYAELEKRITQLEQVRMSTTAPPPAVAAPRSRFITLFETVGLVAIAGAIFWLGALHNKVSTTEIKVDKLSDAIMSTSKESISSRVAVIETRTAAIESKLDAIDKKLDSLK